MKYFIIAPTLLQAAVLFVACAVAVNAVADPEGDAREKKALHRMQLQLNAVQQEKAELADQVEALKKKVGELESKRAALEKKLNGQSKEISELSDKQLSEKQQLADCSDKYKLMEQQYSASSKDLQQTRMEAEQEKKKLDGEIQVCEKKNSELYQLSVKLMDKYQSKGVMDALLQKEPFTQLEKVRMENLLQEYRDKSEVNRILSTGNDAQDARHTPEEGGK